MRGRFAVLGVFGVSRSLNGDGLLGVGYRTSFLATGASGVNSRLCIPRRDGQGLDGSTVFTEAVVEVVGSGEDLSSDPSVS